MAQWDVYVNPSARTRADVPYFVDLQSSLLDGLPDRLMAPLVTARVALDRLPRRLSPAFTINGCAVVLVPYQAGPIESRRLKNPVVSLRACAHEISDAIDAVLSGI